MHFLWRVMHWEMKPVMQCFDLTGGQELSRQLFYVLFFKKNSFSEIFIQVKSCCTWMQLSARHHFCLFEKKAWGKDWRSCQACHSGFQFVLPHTCAVIMTLLSQISRTLSTVNSPAASGGVQLVRRSLTTSSKMASSGHRIERDTFGKKWMKLSSSIAQEMRPCKCNLIFH